MNAIFYNGKIITMESRNGQLAIQNAPEAILVENGSIKKVGTLTDVRYASGPLTEEFDLKGRCLLPSFIDAHSHFVMNGQLSLCADLSGCGSYDEIINTLKQYIREHRITKCEAVLGFGYDHNFLKEGGQPDKRVLDQVSAELPIFVLHVSAHLACANSMALQLAGIHAKTENPQGGVIGRFPGSSEPTGYLEENAMVPVQNMIAQKLNINVSDRLEHMQDIYISNGITTAQDGATSEKDMLFLEALSSSGALKMDLVAYPLMTAGGTNILHSHQSYCRSYRNRLKIGGYKLILDGSPQGRSAWLTQPYFHGAPDYCGYPWLDDQTVKDFISTAVQENQQLLVHCNGDAASEQYLNTYESVIKETRNTQELRPVMIHCQTVRDDQLDRMAKLNMIASIFVGHVWYWGDIHKKNLGEIRGNHISPVKSAVDRGVIVNFHQDSPVTKPNMLHSIWCAVNRYSRSGSIIGEDQKISVYEALKAVTLNAAYQYFEENEKGSIKEGKRADLIILDQSPLEVAPKDIKNLKVLMTIKDGNVIFQSQRN
ncbi:MAG: amidohydrolase [Lachnospiraceae bacterium]|nr:amidohydrolase [Lachnospiraceae bacterium]